MDARKEKSRAAIVAAFSELLREVDYGKITVGDIIARAHVGRATFYGLFKSKDDLLSELVSDICTHALDDDGGGGYAPRYKVLVYGPTGAVA